jgi:hypothetical protein
MQSAYQNIYLSCVQIGMSLVQTTRAPVGGTVREPLYLVVSSTAQPVKWLDTLEQLSGI